MTGNDFLNDLGAWLPRLTRAALGATNIRLSPDEIRAVAAVVRELSRGFTRERELAGERYFGTPANLAAYLLYFWPVSYMQTRLVLDRMIPPRLLRDAAVLDAGSGPAPSSFAMLDAGAARVVAADYSRAATGIALKLAKDAKKNLVPAFWDIKTGSAAPTGTFDLIIMSHAVNELWAERADRVILRTERVLSLAEKLSKNGRLIIIDPALKTTTRDLLSLHDSLLDRGLPVAGPCLHQNHCPCLSDPEATCHADFFWQPPGLSQRIAHAARLGKETLRFSLLVVGKAGNAVSRPADEKTWRVVSQRMLSKSGRLRYFICGAQGRVTLSAKTGGNESWQRLFATLQRYDVIHVENPEAREHGLGLTEASVVKKIDPRAQ